MELTDSEESRLMKELQDAVKEPFFMKESSHADDTNDSHEDESTVAVAKVTAHDTGTSASQQLSTAYNVQRRHLAPIFNFNNSKVDIHYHLL